MPSAKDLREVASDLSLFIQESKVRRRGDLATVIVKVLFEGEDKWLSVSLIGFEDEASKSDFELKEEAFNHLRLVLEEVARINKRKNQ